MSNPISELAHRFGDPKEILCELPSVKFPPLSERKHGEVCMAILRNSGRFLLQTKRSYPNSVMRLPSGGIKPGENIEHALLREIWEETNLDVHIERFVAVVRYRDGSGPTSFRSYLFLVREVQGVLQNNDPKERITEWREAADDELPYYAGELRKLGPSWNNWGRFRAASLDALSEHLATREVGL